MKWLFIRRPFVIMNIYIIINMYQIRKLMIIILRRVNSLYALMFSCRMLLHPGGIGALQQLHVTHDTVLGSNMVKCP